MNEQTSAAARPGVARRGQPAAELTSVLRRRRGLRADLIQLGAAVIAAVLAFVAPQIPSGFTIPSGRAIQMLIAVGAGMTTFIGIVFSLLFLVVQFGATTFTPRLNLFRDAPIVWRAFALYSAVVVYCFTAAIVISGDETSSGLVPLIALIGILASIVVYRGLQMSAFRSIQLSATLAAVSRRGRQVIDGLYAPPSPADGDIIWGTPTLEPAEPEVAHSVLRWPRPEAVLQIVDVPRILNAAEHAGVTVQLTVGVGDQLWESGAIGYVVPAVQPEVEAEVLDALTVGDERTFEQDPVLALRVLADIALRALSPAVNDPTTAVQSIDSMGGLLRRVVRRDLDIGCFLDASGQERLVLSMPTWDDYLATALDDVTAMPALPPAAATRIEHLLDELRAAAPPARRAALDRRLDVIRKHQGLTIAPL